MFCSQAIGITGTATGQWDIADHLHPAVENKPADDVPCQAEDTVPTGPLTTGRVIASINIPYPIEGRALLAALRFHGLV